MGELIELRKDPRGTGECASPWGGRRVDLGREPAADWNEGLTALATTVIMDGAWSAASVRGLQVEPRPGEPDCGTRPGVPFTANRGIGYEGSVAPERDWIGLGDVVDAIAVRLAWQLAGAVDAPDDVPSPTVFCPR